MRIVVTGASGLIGSTLVPALRADGNAVSTLVRRPPRADGEIRWDPTAGQLDPADLAGTEAVVHLAGAGIGDRRWTDSYRRVLRESRLVSTDLLTRTLARLDPPPRVLLAGSAVGWYGTDAHGAAGPLDESAPAGSGFLARLVEDWEAAAEPARAAGIRVSTLRTGVVLSTRGGSLARQLPLFRFGVGGRLGSGRQWLSWISLPDHVAATRFLLGADAPAGPVNLVAPEPVTNTRFTSALAAALHRPAFAAVPGFALRAVLGGFADEGVLASQRLAPAALRAAGFGFAHPDIDTALRALLSTDG
ncbi:TIGR01777 family oxidoreductase [Frankia sp. AgKG'84/4]|uniref:TIGR01777 family oxidoreductase n=1 Tax=Frankia sp. AgKG'84/4 TaxID=573490 RepID=UPI00200ED9F9|nr:TIGR01777 family oxidoreductase [Frankia sp. AgKG'84/4]MCL9798345.1 TIGR01777 family oxidoreductase [Frankia sp. AgKG'84/4]